MALKHTPGGPPPPLSLIAFDLDGTLVSDTVFIWSTLHEYFQTDAARRLQARDDFFEGRIDYPAWFATDLALLKARGATHEKMLAALSALRPSPGAHEALASLKDLGFKLAVISGSLDLVLHHFFDPAQFAHVLINRIDFDEAGQIQGGTPTEFDLEGKARGLLEIARREGLPLSACAFVGDNTNDLDVMRAAGFAVGIHIKSQLVRQVVDLEIDSGDLRDLVPVLARRGPA